MSGKGLQALIDLGFCRILTTGRRAQIEDGAQTVRRTISQASGRIEILPGGMVPRNVARLVAEIGCDQIHIASFLHRSDPSPRGNAEIHFGAALYPPEDSYDFLDGTGYPGLVKDIHDKDLHFGPGKKGSTIPLSGRIVALADVYDA